MDVGNSRSGRSQRCFAKNSPKPVTNTTLRSVPIDPRYTYDIAREIRNAWSNHESKCCPDTSPYCELHREATPRSESATPGTQRKPLAAQLKEPSPLLAPGPIDPQNTSPLFSKLPPEIRAQIWAHLLTYPSVILLVADGGLPRTQYARYLAPSLLSSCRRIHLEAVPILYGRNAFSVVHIPNMLRSRSSAPRFVLSPRYFPLLRRLNIDIPDKWIERRVFATRWGAELERYVDVLGALVSCASPTLHHLQISLVRNCALESYTSWGPYVAYGTPLIQAVAKEFLPAARENGGGRTKLLLVLPCGGDGGGGSGDDGGGGGCGRVALDVLRPDAPALIHAVARNLGTLQKTARLNGVRLAESLIVEVTGERGHLLERDTEAEVVVRRVDEEQMEGPPQIVLSLTDQAGGKRQSA